MHVRRRTGRGRQLLPAVGLAAVVLVTATGSFANSGANTSGPPNIQGEAGTLPNVDNRRGRNAPTAGQRDQRQARFRSAVQQVRRAARPSLTQVRTSPPACRATTSQPRRRT